MCASILGVFFIGEFYEPQAGHWINNTHMPDVHFFIVISMKNQKIYIIYIYNIIEGRLASQSGITGPRVVFLR